MRFSDIIVEQQLTEKPMGFLSKMGNKVASAFGSGAAQGRVETGNIANQLRKEYDVYLGKTGGKPSGENLIAFLKSKGYPTGAAQQAIGGGAQQPAAGQQQQGQQPDAATQARIDAAPQGYDTETGKPNPAAAQPQQGQQQKQPAANKADTDSYEKFKSEIRQVQQPKPGATPLPDNIAKSIEPLIANLAKGDKESGSLAARKILGIAGKNYDVSKLASQWAASSKAGERFLTQSVFISISKMLQEYGLYWSDLGIKVRLDESVRGGVYISLKPSKTTTGSKFFESQLNFYRIIKENLTPKQLDAAFMAAAQEKAKQDSAGSVQPATPSQEPQQGKSGVSGMDFAKAAYDGMRGADLGSSNQKQSSQVTSNNLNVDQIIDIIKPLTLQDKIKIKGEIEKSLNQQS